MAEELGVGYVRLVPTMRGFQGAAQREMNAALPGPAKAAGSTAGTAAATGFRGSMAKGLKGVRGKLTGALKGAGGAALGAAAGFMAFGAVKGVLSQ